MFITPKGFSYESEEELNYNILNAVGLSTLQNGAVIDTEIGVPIMFGGKTLKCNIDSRNIHYAGEGEVMLDIINNLKMSITLFGLLLDKTRVFEDKEIYTYYTEEMEVENGLKKTQLVVMFEDKSTVASDFFYNKSLAYIDTIFKLEEIDVNLDNFDSQPVVG